MDGENNGKPYEKWMIWGYHHFWKHPYRCIIIIYLYLGFFFSHPRSFCIFCTAKKSRNGSGVPSCRAVICGIASGDGVYTRIALGAWVSPGYTVHDFDLNSNGKVIYCHTQLLNYCTNRNFWSCLSYNHLFHTQSSQSLSWIGKKWRHRATVPTVAQDTSGLKIGSVDNPTASHYTQRTVYTIQLKYK